ncbi:hypothetical protein F5144DRAFT_548438 [Chaetomium tenue]|uniref:Uncharacterized protein n=1 Tax=Chaetomium tenue TaxID=1854479 RepID=A0ACB7PAK0_9PEZI|nr:hypothetical protein F5144DRAFT_548438 [Chaetomium globosum]
MASHEPDTSTVTVGDIASMSDAALAVFIQKNRGPDGVFDLPVDGWDKLSKDERDQLAERLTRTLAQNPAAHSRPLDLDQLDARLPSPEFSDYVDAVKRRLARHGFTRPFELNQDPKQQGEFETWIEYLGFECWWLDLFTGAIERGQEHHDEETVECAMQCQAEEDEARAAVKRFEENAQQIYDKTQLHPHRLRIPRAERRWMLQQGTRDMLTARSRLERLKKRGDLITKFVLSTNGLETAKRDAARHRILIQWILDQIPLIEAGLSPQQTGIKKRRPSPRLSDGAVVLNSSTVNRLRLETNSGAHGPDGLAPGPRVGLKLPMKRRRKASAPAHAFQSA